MWKSFRELRNLVKKSTLFKVIFSPPYLIIESSTAVHLEPSYQLLIQDKVETSFVILDPRLQIETEYLISIYTLLRKTDESKKYISASDGQINVWGKES